MLYDQYYPFEIIPLGYDYSALEPDIGEYTMFFHYNEHYLPALEKLNEAVKDIPLYQNIPLEQLTKSDDISLRHSAGNVFTHEMHFLSLTDNESQPSEYMVKRINENFGSMDNFFGAIKNAAAELYGSGGIWLAENNGGNLVILITKEHETPDFERYHPVYNLDLWEHGYYLDRQNNRNAYVDAAIKHINWEEMERNLKS